MIYYFTEGKRVDELLYVCKSLELHILTTKKAIHEYSEIKGISSTLISNNPRRFKNEIRKISPSSNIRDFG